MSNKHRSPRRGALLICVLVCLLVASALVTATTRSALRSRREVESQHQLRQTELLLDAGILRAARQLRKSDDYRGESWRPADSIERFDNALVDIRVSVDDDGTHHVEVAASLGAAVNDKKMKASRTRRTHKFSIENPDSLPTAGSPTSAE